MIFKAFHFTLGLALASGQILLAQTGPYSAEVMDADQSALTGREALLASIHPGFERFESHEIVALPSLYPSLGPTQPQPLAAESPVMIDATVHGVAHFTNIPFSFESPSVDSKEWTRSSVSLSKGTRTSGIPLGPSSVDSIAHLSAQHSGNDRLSLELEPCWSACWEIEVGELDELPVVQQLGLWHIRVDDGLNYTFPKHACHLVLCSVDGSEAPRGIDYDVHGVGFLFRFDFAQHKQARQSVR